MNQRYAFGSNQFLTGQLNWLTQTFRVVLINTNFYTINAAVHATLLDIPANAQIAVSTALASKTAVGGVARAADLTITGVVAPVEAFAIFHDTGAAGSSELIAFIDTAVDLPFNPQSSNVVIHWDTGPNGIFKL